MLIMKAKIDKNKLSDQNMKFMNEWMNVLLKESLQ